jgi:two-component system chemotaxis sensor kinase CheA
MRDENEEILDPELIQAFLEEATESLQRLDNDFIGLEKNPKDKDIIAGIFRTVHSIKGNSGFFGFKKLESLAHTGENLLSELRNVKLTINEEITTALLDCVDGIRNILSHIADNMTEGNEDYTSLEAVLRELQQSGTHSDANADKAKTDAALPQEEIAVGSQTKPVESVNESGVRAANSRPAKAAEASIRVQLNLVETLINQVGELVLARNQLLQHLSLKDEVGTGKAGVNLDLITTSLQENIMKTRLQPIGNVFGKFPRVVRDMERLTGKKINLVVEGESTEVDKTLIEAIADPLTHIIRNAVDHGIEAPDIRQQTGKPITGTITLKAFHEGGQVIVEVADDGAGISRAKVIDKAIQNGLITKADAESMTSSQMLKLLFEPGFSTASTVTNISGRGVGMDVVKTNIEKVRGVIDIETNEGKGSVFRLQIPLTLAIIPALIVAVGEHRFAIPQVNLIELLYFEGDEIPKNIRAINGTDFIFHRGGVIPVVRLRKLFELQDRLDFKTQAETSMYVVIVKSGTELFGLAVDTPIDSEEIVVKPLISHVKRLGCFAGATIMGDGCVVLILDIPGIARLLELKDRPTEFSEELVALEESQLFLIFSVGKKDRFALPVVLISRIEEFHISSLMPMGHRRAVIYNDHLLPLIDLSDHVPCEKCEMGEPVTVLVLEFETQQIGIIVNEVLDSVAYSGTIDAVSFSAEGILGSLIVNRDGVLLLDIFKIIDIAEPGWFERSRKKDLSAQVDERMRILLVEDSPFFLNLERGYLEGAGFDVVCATDGSQGLNIIKNDPSFNLVVTDIEMPNMDGLAMCKAIRSDLKMDKIPIMIITSLNSLEIREKAQAVGIDDFQVKVNREDIVSNAKRLTFGRQAAL